LRDLVSYDRKHNQANGARQSRALLATLLLSFGVPLLLGGDELGRSQGGDNNAYCQDNPTSWLDWSRRDEGLLAFARRMVAFRRAHPVFRRRRFLVGIHAAELAWFTPSGVPMTIENWADPNARALAIYLDGDDDPDLASDGTPLLDDDFLVLVNGWGEPLEFRVPEIGEPRTWRTELDTYAPTPATNPPDLQTGDTLTLGPQSIVVLQSEDPPGE
jgi:glycogen operon protein